MKQKINSLLFLFFLLPLLAIAQSVSGTVTETSSNLPLPGVNVTIKGTSNGTATDFDGNFQINANTGDIITFSYIGYLAQEIKYAGEPTLNVSLQEDTAQLDEVVIIGYGSSKKEDLTGSVDVVTSKEFNKGAIVSADQLLTGKAAGVRITNDGGSPDSAPNIRIRGGASLTANNNPLIIIDGIPIGTQNPAGVSNPLSLINPNDVESFTVLKDASATAIYGSRASNGVIIITTKIGTTGDVKFNFSTDATISRAGEGLDVLNGEEYVRFIREFFPDNDQLENNLGVPLGSVSNNSPFSVIITPNGEQRAIYDSDWRSTIFRTAFSSNANFSARTNLGENLPFRASIGYNNSQGLIRTDDYERISSSFKLTPKLFNEALTIDLNAKGVIVNKNAVNTGDALNGALVFDPTKPIFDENSIFNGLYTNTRLDNSGRLILDGQANPLAILEDRTRPERAFRFLGNTKFNYRLPFLPELSAVLNLGADASRVNIKERFRDNALSSFGIDENNNVIFNPGISYEERQHITNTTLDAYLNYTRSFEESLIKRFDIQGGYAYQNFKTDGVQNLYRISEGQDGEGPRGFRYQVFNPQNPNNRYFNELNLQSFFGRTNIDIADQILVTLSFRADGSSLFVEDNRWGYFPAAAVAWKLSNIAAIEESIFFNDLKLRLGWGKTGQQDITGDVGFYPSLPLFSAGNQNSQYLPGINLYSADAFNPDLTWEKTSTYNVGLDFDFFKNRVLSGSLDFFKRETTDLLARVPIPPGQFLTNAFVKNVGSTESEGFELNLNLNAIQEEYFNFKFNTNVAYAITEVTDLEDVTTLRDPNSTLTGTGTVLIFNNLNQQPFSAGVFKQLYDTGGNPIPGAFVDRNNDGEITDDDKYFVPVRPNWTFGLGFNANYKNWDLSSTFRGQLDGKVFNFNALNLGNRESALPGNNLSSTNVLNFYNGTANPVFQDVRGNKQFSDYYLENAAFVRCENIVLGYRFKDGFVKNTSMRFYAALNNPFVISEYSGQDPENFSGIDRTFYPRPRSFTFGFNLDF